MFAVLCFSWYGALDVVFVVFFWHCVDVFGACVVDLIIFVTAMCLTLGFLKLPVMFCVLVLCALESCNLLSRVLLSFVMCDFVSNHVRACTLLRIYGVGKCFKFGVCLCVVVLRWILFLLVGCFGFALFGTFVLDFAIRLISRWILCIIWLCVTLVVRSTSSCSGLMSVVILGGRLCL